MRSYLQFANPFRRTLLGLLALLVYPMIGSAQTVSLDNVQPFALSTSTTLSALTINPENGNVTIRSALGNINQCTAPPPSNPTIQGFFPSSGSTTTPGSQITLTWSSINTTSCSPQQGSPTIWPSLGTLPTNGSQNFTAPAATGTYTFQLTCTDGTQSTSATTQVTVQSQGSTCPPSYPGGTLAAWSASFNGNWPTYGSRRRIDVPGGTYIALAFTATNTVGQFGSVNTGDFPGDGDGFGQMSISRDPGCFNAALLGPGCLGGVGRNPSVGWINSTTGTFRCTLTPGQSYYLNFTYGGAGGGGGLSCPSGACAADVVNFQTD